MHAVLHCGIANQTKLSESSLVLDRIFSLIFNLRLNSKAENKVELLSIPKCIAYGAYGILDCFAALTRLIICNGNGNGDRNVDLYRAYT